MFPGGLALAASAAWLHSARAALGVHCVQMLSPLAGVKHDVPAAQSASATHASRQASVVVGSHASCPGQGALATAQLPSPSHIPVVSVEPLQLVVPQSVALSG